MHNIKDLKIWNKSIDLAIRVYDVSAKFPVDERYGLISQIRRCAVSIPSNISEGAGRNSNKEFLQFLGIANGSSYELQTQLVITERLGFIDTKICSELLESIDELQKMNFNLQKSIRLKL
ncbi:MAG: four helix bundle protein [Sphingobacteriales bacterium 17-39-43]|uniref:four helix bundle protein n=1 Tax=Daejeonella sp. TaxID=2805397 RepID=UPI000BD74FE2|nr:four helix bundle protein [Daejeonella sp.]OYZ30864.1 MAG: four helix bundle protein [Sphingobacteriales bacterium 16-39-50]OZA23650.1 MAG: four helix bundle protein [Sphingobacteriales bacterium 17-39-43]HQT23487.1 four helix bundle protein [Daejeonella sp.]HQT58364.1 four helix bundle protein [Daejeonella sp.]